MISSRSQLFAAIAAIAILSIADMSFAQGGRGDRGGRFFGGGGMTGLLRNDKVQEELELVDEQLEDIEELQSELREEMMQMFRGGGFRDMDPEERRLQMEEMREKIAVRTKEMEAEVKDILLPHQFSRLKQLNFQQESTRGGTAGLANSETIIAALEITDEQKEKMKKAAEAAAKKLEDKIKELRKQAETEVLGVLTEEQRAKFKELRGDSFDFGQNQRGRFGGQRGDRGGRGGNRGDRGGQRERGGQGARPESDF